MAPGSKSMNRLQRGVILYAPNRVEISELHVGESDLQSGLSDDGEEAENSCDCGENGESDLQSGCLFAA